MDFFSSLPGTVMALQAKGLVKRYRGRAVVKGVDLEVEPGEVVGLLGPNGAGKTTIFSMIVGLVRPDGGEIYLDQERITSLSIDRRARKGVGYLCQEPSVFRGLTVRQNILAVLELRDLSERERSEQMLDCLHALEIEHLADQRAALLSGGERRRVELARARALSPRFLLLDEPFAGIDPLAVGEIQGLIGRLRDRKIGVLITDHNVQETLRITDRAYVISEGTILEEGTPDKIAASPRARAVYLGERFQLQT